MTEDEVDLSELDCKLFVDGAPDSRELSAWIAEIVNGKISEDGVVAAGVEMFVDDNDDAGLEDKAVRKRGFLFFDNVVEFYFAPRVDLNERVALVSAVLNDLWRRGLRAVAACDYEDRLPLGGGTADSAPWPARLDS